MEQIIEHLNQNGNLYIVLSAIVGALAVVLSPLLKYLRTRKKIDVKITLYDQWSLIKPTDEESKLGVCRLQILINKRTPDQHVSILKCYIELPDDLIEFKNSQKFGDTVKFDKSVKHPYIRVDRFEQQDRNLYPSNELRPTNIFYFTIGQYGLYGDLLMKEIRLVCYDQHHKKYTSNYLLIDPHKDKRDAAFEEIQKLPAKKIFDKNSEQLLNTLSKNKPGGIL